MKIVVMIPAFNEEKTIGNVIRKIPREFQDENKVEVLVVDDGSSDRTVEIAKQSGAERVIHHSTNRGVGAAFSTGIENALDMGADVIVNIDADGQFNSKDIPNLVQPILKDKADIIIGSRFIEKELVPQMPFVKRFGNKIFTGLINLLAKRKFTDTQCGFRAYSRDSVMKLTLFGDFTYTQEIFLQAVKKDMRIIEVPVQVKYDDDRRSRVVKNPINYAIRALIIILRTVRDYAPLKFFGIIGLITILSGLICGSYILSHWLRTGAVTPHIPLTVLTSILLIAGFQMAILALIADMMGRNRKILEDTIYMIKKRNYTKEKKNE